MSTMKVETESIEAKEEIKEETIDAKDDMNEESSDNINLEGE